MSNPLVSICIPTYNGLQYLKECIDSALEQTYANVEIVIIDDCSTDATWALISEYVAKDKRVRAYKNEKNAGLVDNWNKCLDMAKGEWIKFLFQDDYMDADCIEQMVKSVERGDKLVTSGRRLIFDPGLDEKVKQYSITQTLTFERLGVISKETVSISAKDISGYAADNICMNFIGEPTVIMFKKECVAEAGYFNADISQLCDLEYFLRIASNYGLKYIPKPLTWFRVHRQSTSSGHMKNKLFMLNHLDPIIITHQMLFGSQYSNLRSSIPGSLMVKLKQFFNVRTYEAKLVALGSADDLRKFEAICGKYAEIKKHAKGGLSTRVILGILKIKRVFTNKG